MIFDRPQRIKKANLKYMQLEDDQVGSLKLAMPKEIMKIEKKLATHMQIRTGKGSNPMRRLRAT
jgi:hypothetical protein